MFWVNRSVSNQLRRRHRIQGNPWKWPIWGAYILGDCASSSAQHRPLTVQCCRNAHFTPSYNTLVKPSASSRAQNKSSNPVTLVRVLQNNRINRIYLHIYLSVTSLFLNLIFIDANGKEPACPCRRHKRCRFDPWVGKIPWRRVWQPTPVFLPGESHGQKEPGTGYSP